MRQTFPPSANIIARASLAILLLVVIGGSAASWLFARSSYMTRVGVVREQPVPFSHEHHVAGLGLDCRYCHTSVETSAFAGIPPTSTCMNCHTQIWADSPLLEPVRESYQSGKPLVWTRVHDVPDFVYFNHEIHVAKGVGCSTCHGRVDRQPLAKKTETLFMQWCLDCHRNPEKALRPRDRVFDMDYVAPGDQRRVGRELAERYAVRTTGMTDCVTCHR